MLRVPRPLCFVVCLLPFVYCLWQVYLYTQGLPNNLGADPGKEIVHFNGKWSMILLLITLGITPLRRLTGVNYIYLRRMIGLFAFFYALVHLTSYLVFLLELNFAGFVDDVIKRPYITLGMLAFAGLIPLAVTSNKMMMRRLRHNWKRLHWLIHPIVMLVMLHFLLQTRSDFSEPLFYIVVLLILQGYRLVQWRQVRLKQSL